MARKKLGNQNPTQSVILKYVKKNSKAKEAVESTSGRVFLATLGKSIC